MEKCFVACINSRLPDLFKSVSRLYAFPAKPDTETVNEFVILDSGAFSLSLKGKEIDIPYMGRLHGYYRKYGAGNSFPVLGIAPDKFPDPDRTMQNYLTWIRLFKLPVVPVIQFSRMKHIDVFLGRKQGLFYREFGNRIIAISNPGLKAKDAQTLKILIDQLRKMDYSWIHCLGAGWNYNDCADWGKLGFDSIDSISYYSDAEKGIAWKPLSYQTGQSTLEYEELCKYNYNLANKAFRLY